MKNIRKRLVPIFLLCAILIAAAGCSKTEEDSIQSIQEQIYDSPAAKLELPDGTCFYVDSEIDLLQAFCDFDLRETAAESSDEDADWLYRITWNPSEKVLNSEEIIVSFYQDYLQIGNAYYTGEDTYAGILEWVQAKFDYAMGA